jgi:transcriptional regulator with XRE-family HTH domain
MRDYRSFLGLTQSGLAERLGTTQTSIARWETGASPISIKTMAHVHEIARERLQRRTAELFKELVPKLLHSEFVDLFSSLTTHLIEDSSGNLYIGSVLIGGCHDYSLSIRVDSDRWYALDKKSRARLVNQEFVLDLLSARK